MKWKNNWKETKERIARWWHGESTDHVALGIISPRNEPMESIPVLEAPVELGSRWIDPYYRINEAERVMASTFYGGDAFPYFDTYMGPGSLATFLGSEPIFAKETVWYLPFITDPEKCGSLSFDSNNKWWQIQLRIVEEGVKQSCGRYIVGMPDLIEGLDT